jgi:hypothetical protein
MGGSVAALISIHFAIGEQMTRNNKPENRHGRLTKAESNRKNSRKSTGPSTPRGKSYSRKNALKHGIYSKELLVSEADRPEYEEMLSGLKAKLKPGTTLQELAFDYCVCCFWRCKLALRLEHSQFASLFQDKPPETKQGETPEVIPVVEQWYGCSRSDTKAGIRGLEFAKAEFEGHGDFREETQKFLLKGFGSHFVSILEDWKPPMRKDAILLANHLVYHRETFGDVPNGDVKSSGPPEETAEVVIDPMQGRHMVCKLLEERRNFLKELLLVNDHYTLSAKADAALISDFNPRFLAAANRELQRALDWYFYLKAKSL